MNLRELGASRSALYWRLVKVKLSVKCLDGGLGAVVMLRAIIKGEKGYDLAIQKAIFTFKDILNPSTLQGYSGESLPLLFLSAPLL